MAPQRTKTDTALTATKRQSGEPVDLPSLQLMRNGTALQELSLDVPQLLIGRAEDNHLSIPSSYVSRHHILLVHHGGCTTLIDLNSTNGTYVNSRRVFNHVLAHDDVITIDTHSMFVRYSIRYSDPSTSTRGKSDATAPADALIDKAVAEIGSLLGNGDTELLPTLGEEVPTVASFVDDR